MSKRYRKKNEREIQMDKVDLHKAVIAKEEHLTNLIHCLCNLDLAEERISQDNVLIGHLWGGLSAAEQKNTSPRDHYRKETQ